MEEDGALAVPDRLRRLVSWQANRVAVLGSRLTLRRMPATARAEFAALAALQQFGPLSQADLGRALGLDRNDVNAVATRLERDGRVVRRPAEDDRRRKILTTTPAGAEHLRDLQDRADAVQAELLGPLSDAEADQLVALLGRLLDGHGPQPA